MSGTASPGDDARSFWSRIDWSKVIFSVVLLAVGGAFLFYFGAIVLVGGVSAWLVGHAALNPWLARALTLALVAVLLWPLSHVVRWMFSLNRDRRIAGQALFCAIAAVVSFGVYLAQPVFTTRAVNRWYAETAWGIEVFDHPGVHPDLGTKLKLYTPEVAAQLRGGPTPIEVAEDTPFFNPYTRNPTKWYCMVDGEYRVFPGPGYDPQYGIELLPVTPEVAPRIIEQVRAAAASAATSAVPQSGSGDGNFSADRWFDEAVARSYQREIEEGGASQSPTATEDQPQAEGGEASPVRPTGPRWEYLARLREGTRYGPHWHPRQVNFEGVPRSNSFQGSFSGTEDFWTFADFADKGKPDRIEMTLGVSDETPPNVPCHFEIRIDDQAPLEYTVQFRQAKKVTLDLRGTVRITIGAERVSRDITYGEGRPLIVEPKIYFVASTE